MPPGAMQLTGTIFKFLERNLDNKDTHFGDYVTELMVKEIKAFKEKTLTKTSTYLNRLQWEFSSKLY